MGQTKSNESTGGQANGPNGGGGVSECKKEGRKPAGPQRCDPTRSAKEGRPGAPIIVAGPIHHFGTLPVAGIIFFAFWFGALGAGAAKLIGPAPRVRLRESDTLRPAAGGRRRALAALAI